MMATSSDAAEIRWIRCGIAGGLCASVLHPTVRLVPVPAVTITAAAFLGSAIGIGSFPVSRSESSGSC